MASNAENGFPLPAVSKSIPFLYGMLTLGSTALWSYVSGWLLYFYLPPAGSGTTLVPAALMGLAILLSQVVNLFGGLPIGYLSDQTRSRWGRRLPFIFAGSLLMPAFFFLVWRPPVAGFSLWNLVYIGGMMALFNLAYSLRQIPYEALLPELAENDILRVRASAFQAGFQMVAVILASFAGILIESFGYGNAGLLYAAVLIPFFFLPLLGLRERPGRQIPVADRIDFRKSLSITLGNRPFQVFLAAWGLYWIASALVMDTIPYIATQICRLSEAETVYLYLPPVLVSLLCFPLVTWLTGRWGKRRVFLASLFAAALVLPGLMLIGEDLPLPLGLQGALWISLEAAALSGAQMLPPAIAAELTDQDANATGQRREGSYYSAWWLFEQIATGLSGALIPILLLLGRSNADANGPLGVRLCGLAGSLFLLAAFLVFRHYPQRAPAQIEM